MSRLNLEYFDQLGDVHRVSILMRGCGMGGGANIVCASLNTAPGVKGRERMASRSLTIERFLYLYLNVAKLP